MVKSVSCSSREPEFGSQYAHLGGSQPIITPTPEDPMTFSAGVHTHGTYWPTLTQTHTLT